MATRTITEQNLLEDDIHKMVVRYLSFTYQKVRYHHSPNEGKRSEISGYRLKQMGMSKGFPDLFIFAPRGIYAGLAIELKRVSGRATKEQKEWIDYLNSTGYKACICYGYDEAVKAIDEYMGGLNG